MTRVKLFATLRETAGEELVEIGGNTEDVEEVIEKLVDKHPELGDAVFDEDGELHEHINILVNGNDADLDTEVGSESEVGLFPPVSGGR